LVRINIVNLKLTYGKRSVFSHLNQNSLCDISQKVFDWALDVPRKEGKMENWKKILATLLKKQKEGNFSNPFKKTKRRQRGERNKAWS